MSVPGRSTFSPARAVATWSAVGASVVPGGDADGVSRDDEVVLVAMGYLVIVPGAGDQDQLTRHSLREGLGPGGEDRLVHGAVRNHAVDLLQLAIAEVDAVTRLGLEKSDEEAETLGSGVDVSCEHHASERLTGQGPALPPPDDPRVGGQAQVTVRRGVD